MSDIHNLQREKNNIIQKLTRRLKRGNYENFGMNELRIFRDHVQRSDLTYPEQCNIIDDLSKEIERIQH